uniref:Uncharacterized protein n=1 Tax=Arundo donax TaxID=35708 RepID=A0A0A9B144_ARUDO
MISSNAKPATPKVSPPMSDCVHQSNQLTLICY